MAEPAQVALRDIAAPGGLVGGPFGSSLVNADYTEFGVPVIRGSNFSSQRYVTGPYAFVSIEKFTRDLARNSALPGDVVFTQRGTLGQVAVVPASEHAEFVISQSQMRLRAEATRADNTFVYYAACDPRFLKQVTDRAISTCVPHNNLGIIAELTIPLPALPQQRAIAEVLGALDDKIAANTRVIDLLDQLGTAKVRRHTTGALVALSSIAVINMGSSPPGTDLSDVPTGIPFYQGVRDFGKRFPGFRVWTEKPVRIAEAGDTLLSVRAPVGRTNLARVRSCIGRGVASLRSTTGTPFTLFHLLATSESAWLPFESEGTVFGSINRKQLGAVLVPTIESSVQTRLESCLASFESQIAATIAANERLAATRDALLPALMSGKLRIKDAERVVSHAV